MNIEKLKVMWDKFLYDNFWKLPLPYNIRFKYMFPTKRLVRYCLEITEFEALKYKYELVAHMYAYDSTVTEHDLSFIHTCYNTCTKERVRQLLAKFIRKYYK